MEKMRIENVSQRKAIAPADGKKKLWMSAIRHFDSNYQANALIPSRTVTAECFKGHGKRMLLRFFALVHAPDI